MAQRAQWLPRLSRRENPKRTPSWHHRTRSQAATTQKLTAGPELAFDACVPGSTVLPAGTHGLGGGGDAWLHMPERRAWKPPKKKQDVTAPVWFDALMREFRAESNDTNGLDCQEKVRKALAVRIAREQQADPLEWQGERRAWKPPEKPGDAALALLLKLTREQEGSDTEAAEEDQSFDTNEFAWLEEMCNLQGANIGPEQQIDLLELASDMDDRSSEGSLVPSPASRDISRRVGRLRDQISGLFRREQHVGRADTRSRSERPRSARTSTRACRVLPSSASSSADFCQASPSSSSSAPSGSGTRAPLFAKRAW